jgi:aldose 1-epimerase
VTRRTLAFVLIAAAIAPLAAFRQSARAGSANSGYSVNQENGIVRLEDRSAGIRVSILPSVGNIAFEMLVRGQNILHWPYVSTDAFTAKPGMSGIPFMGPWANRLDEQAFYANGTRYAFDMSLGNVRGAIPIHGFLTTTDRWQVVEAKTDATAAWTTSRLEFFKQPAWMKQWPFAHTIDMTYRLRNGSLEVRTTITNMAAEPMPIAVGFHPYFRLPDASRDDWRLSLGARTHWLLAPTKLPTGETEPMAPALAEAAGAPLRSLDLDDVYADLVRDARGVARMTLRGRSQRLDVDLDPQFKAVVIWAPAQSPFMCIEPMAGVTNALNLAQRGRYSELQSVAAGATWQASFWVTPSGF